MIYRIKIVDNGKFVRYASKKELLTLRIDTNGKVQKLGYYEPSKCNAPIIPYTSGSGLLHGWQDVSDTHEVERGVNINGFLTYENDVILTSIYCGEYSAIDYLLVIWEKHEFLMRSLTSNEMLLFGIETTDRVLGNINENPELMEKSNE